MTKKLRFAIHYNLGPPQAPTNPSVYFLKKLFNIFRTIDLFYDFCYISDVFYLSITTSSFRIFLCILSFFISYCWHDIYDLYDIFINYSSLFKIKSLIFIRFSPFCSKLYSRTCNRVPAWAPLPFFFYHLILFFILNSSRH